MLYVLTTRKPGFVRYQNVLCFIHILTPDVVCYRIRNRIGCDLCGTDQIANIAKINILVNEFCVLVDIGTNLLPLRHIRACWYIIATNVHGRVPGK